MSGKKKPTNVYSPLNPEWISFGEETNYPASFWTIISFYLLHSLCKGQSNKQNTLSKTYGWKENPWTQSEYLKDKLKNAIWSGEESYICVADCREKYEGTIFGKRLNHDFYLDLSTQRMGYVKVSDNSNRSTFMSFFYHLRNALAHGRFGIVPLSNDDYMLIIEDGEPKGDVFEVTARMIVKASSLLKIRDIIIKGPDEDVDYSKDIIDSIKRGNNTKSKVLKDLVISGLIWDREIQKMRMNNVVSYEGKAWKVLDSE